MAIDLLLTLVFAAMALWVSAEVSLSPAQNRLQSRINLGLTVATHTVSA